MRWVTVAILILLLALVLRMELLAYAMYVFLAVLLLSRLLSQTWAHSVTAERECNRLTAEVGDTVAVVVTLQNTGRIPIAWLLAEDLLPRRALMFRPPDLQLHGNRLQLQMIKAHGRTSTALPADLQPPRLLPTRTAGGGNRGLCLGCTGASAWSPNHISCSCIRRSFRSTGFDIASRRPIGEVRMSYRLYEDPTRINGVRAYQPGDPLNRIHWRATARTGTLHSKIYEPSSIAGATVLLEFHRPAIRSGTNHSAANWPSWPPRRSPTPCTRWGSRSAW